MLKTRSLLGLALLAAAGIASAGEAHEQANRQFALSIGAHHLDYAETDPQGVLDPFSAERGAQGAVRATFGYQGAFVDVQDLYFRIDLATAQGNTTYEGGLQDGEGNHIPLTSTTRNRFYDASLRIGKSFTYTDDPNWQFTPYVQFATRHWVRELGGEGGYREDYEHQDAGAGLLLQWAGARTVVSLDVGYSQMIEARMEVPEGQLSFAGLASDPLKFKLGTEGVFTASVGLNFALNTRSHLLANYSFKKFEYGISGATAVADADGFLTGALLEPASSSKEQSLFIGFAVSY